jgi:hypothetical protein
MFAMVPPQSFAVPAYENDGPDGRHTTGRAILVVRSLLGSQLSRFDSIQLLLGRGKRQRDRCRSVRFFKVSNYGTYRRVKAT